MTQHSKVSLMTIPDTILGTQFFPYARYSPEQKLMWAILADCYNTLSLAGSVPERAVVLDAREWVEASDYRWPFSFVNICHALDLDVERIRVGFLDVINVPKSVKKSGPNGEMLPRGVCLHTSRDFPFRVTTYDENGKSSHVRFATAEEAVAFHAEYRRNYSKQRVVNWQTKPLYRARSKTDTLCIMCHEPIVRGDAYRIVQNATYKKSAHETCIQAHLVKQVA